MNGFRPRRSLRVDDQFLRCNFGFVVGRLADTVHAAVILQRQGRIRRIDDDILLDIDSLFSSDFHRGILCESVYVIFPQDAGSHIILVVCPVARNGIAEFRNCLASRNITGRRIGVEALAILPGSRTGSREGDVARLLRHAGSRQAFGNPDCAGQMAVRMVRIPQLVRQFVQHFADMVLRTGAVAVREPFRDSLAVRQQRNGGVFRGTGNLEIAASDGFRRRTVMLVDNRRVTTVIGNRNRSLVILENDAGRRRTTAARQLMDMGNSVICFVMVLARGRHMFRIQAIRFSAGLMFPRSPILQPHIHFTGIVCPRIVNDTLPFGSGSRQPDVRLPITVKILSSALFPTGVFHRDNVPQQRYIMGSCSIFGNIDIDAAAVIGQCIISVRRIIRGIDFHGTAVHMDDCILVIGIPVFRPVVVGICSDSRPSPGNIHIAIKIPGTAVNLAIKKSRRSPAGARISIIVAAIHVAGSPFIGIPCPLLPHGEIAVQCEFRLLPFI